MILIEWLLLIQTGIELLIIHACISLSNDYIVCTHVFIIYYLFYSSSLWLQYMAFYLHTAEVDKARSVARKALTTISFRLVVKNVCIMFMCIYKYMHHVYMKYLQYVHVHVHKIPLACTYTCTGTWNTNSMYVHEWWITSSM